MKKYDRSLLIFFGITAAASVIFTVIRCVLTLTSLEVDYGVYRRGDILPDIFHIILALACIAATVLVFIKKPSRGKDYAIPYSDFTVFTSFAAAFLMFLRSALLAYNIVIMGAEYSTFDILEILFSIPSIVYFIMLPMKKASAALAAASFFPIAWCTANLIRIYFDNSQLMTSPNKIMSEMALLSAMLYFLNESRNLLGIFSHRFYRSTAFVSSVLLLTSAVPNVFLSDLLSLGSTDSFTIHAICAILGLFILGRLLAYAKIPEVTVMPEVDTAGDDDTGAE